ncbi:hypothetical protein [Furfurilactobacillus curtus]|uniref:Uncharacterized protein n=1 Tax=Furfurilactobacillus curtus TaxID=1746200 RepID=A0ABQ5JP26_9LACO
MNNRSGRTNKVILPTPMSHHDIHKQYEQATNGLRDKNVIYGVARSGEEAVSIVRDELKLLEDKR